jgi:ribosomal protein L17
VFTKDNARDLGARGGRQSKKRDQITQQIIAELQEAVEDSTGAKVTKMRKLVVALIDKAIDGDVPAAREIMDRVEGKVTQIIGGDPEAPLEITEIRRTIIEPMFGPDGAIIPRPRPEAATHALEGRPES